MQNADNTRSPIEPTPTVAVIYRTTAYTHRTVRKPQILSKTTLTTNMIAEAIGTIRLKKNAPIKNLNNPTNPDLPPLPVRRRRSGARRRAELVSTASTPPSTRCPWCPISERPGVCRYRPRNVARITARRRRRRSCHSSSRTAARPSFRPAGVVELQDKRAAGDDAGAARQEISAHHVLEDAALSRALRADDDDLRKVDGGLSDGAEYILQLVDYGYQVLHRRFIAAVSSVFRVGWGWCV